MKLVGEDQRVSGFEPEVVCLPCFPGFHLCDETMNLKVSVCCRIQKKCCYAMFGALQTHFLLVHNGRILDKHCLFH